jgi:hypothetical protein
VLSALAVFVGASSLLPGGARAEAAQSGSPAAQIGISKVSPQIPDFTDLTKPMTLSGLLRNTGPTTLRHAYVEIRQTQVKNRSEMGSATAQSHYLDDFVKNSQLKLPDVAPNAQAPWTLTLSESDLFGGYSHPAEGVYAFDVLLIDADGDFLSGQRTFLEWKPLDQKNTKSARIALMWPVVGQPGLTGQKKADNSALPILPDQSAAQQFEQGSRLDRILNDPSGLTVNWLVDPDVLYTAQELAGGYFYPDPQNGGRLTGAQSTETDAANGWYTHASDTVSSSPNCWNLLYGDPDLNTLSRSSAGQALLKDAVALQPPALTGCRQSGPTVAWPSDGQADAATLSAIAGMKASNQVTLVGSNQVSVWPSAHASLPNSPNTVVYDNYLSSLFATPAQGSQPSLSNAGVLAGQEWLAQTALADSDNTNRVLVVTPPRNFDPPKELLDAIKAGTMVPAKSQWFGLDSLNQVLSTPTTAQRTSALTKIATPSLPVTVVKQASDSQRLYTALHAIMLGHTYDPAVPFRPVSTSWRNQSGAGPYSKAVYDTAVSDHALVSFGSQTPPLTMSGKSGTVPVTVKNQTNATIRVYLRTSTSHSVDLKVSPTQGAHDVDPGQSATIRIPVQGRGNGEQVTLSATLYTCAQATSECAYYPSDLLTSVNPSGGQTQVTVKVSRIGIIALALIIGSGVLLVLLIGLRVLRAKRAHHAPAQDTMAS